MRIAALLYLVLATLLATPAAAQTPRRCAEGVCEVQLTPNQLLAAAEKLVQMRRFAEARPLVAALAKAPGYRLETRFLTGFMAAEEGRYAEAAEQYKAILADDPRQTRVRLELGKAMLALNQPASADRQFKIAAQDKELPPEIARTIRGVRDVIRSQRAWRLDLTLGIAPDTNINNATNAQSVTVQLGDLALPLSLDPSAQERSGTGLTGSVSAGARLPIAKQLMLQAGIDGIGTNYSGTRYDDFQLQATLGPELALSQRTRTSLGAVAAQRWFGGRVASRQVGAQAGMQTLIGRTDRLGVQLDARRTRAEFDRNYDGWQTSLYGTYEHALSKSVVVSFTGFARRDWLHAPAYSSREVGGIVGVGGELPFGINFGVSGGVSRARYDAPMPVFSPEPRRDTRWNARLTLGDRKIRVLGFSPEVSISYARNRSSLTLYDTHRARFQFALARYF